MKKFIVFLAVSIFALGTTGCGSSEGSDGNGTVRMDTPMQISIEDEAESDVQEIGQVGPAEEAAGSESVETMDVSESDAPSDKEESNDMVMNIGDTPVQVVWEDNESIEALRQLVAESPLIIQMSMYGGFEQVGSIGQSLPRDDEQTTTKAGDIVLYSGNQMVVFYGSNSWAYTRLGYISDKNEKELAELLGNGNVTITIENGGN